MVNKNKVKKTMNEYELKNVLPPKYCKHCGSQTKNRNIIVSASNEEEAILMRIYLKTEGFEA
jgi:hypothetical protein